MPNTPLHDTAADPFSEPGFRNRARKGLLGAPSQAIFDPRSGRALGPSDWDLSPEFLGDLAVMGPPRAAAVLVPIMLRPQLAVLLTQRSHDMPSHPGQISFPGGKLEECDTSPIDCALREACEEIGLTGDFVEPLGYLDSYRTGTGFQISPVVAFVRPGFSVARNPVKVSSSIPKSVARLISVPITPSLSARTMMSGEGVQNSTPSSTR